MADFIDDHHAARAMQARRALQTGLVRLRAAGFQCELTQTDDGTYARIALTFSRPGQDERVINSGWAIGEPDNESLAFTYMTLEVLKLVGARETPRKRAVDRARHLK